MDETVDKCVRLTWSWHNLGKEGIFESVDKDGDYRIRVNGSANFWNPALVEMVVGAKVVRGPDWKYGDQDVGAGSRGTVTSVQADGDGSLGEGRR